MKLGVFFALLAVNVVVTANQDVSAQDRRQSVADGANSKGSAQVKPTGKEERGTPEGFIGEKTSWYGFDRFDLLMDDAALTVKPFKASSEEGTGVNGQVEGQLRCIVVVPKEAAPGKPWSWRGRYFDHEPQAEIELLKRGFHICFTNTNTFGSPGDANVPTTACEPSSAISRQAMPCCGSRLAPRLFQEGTRDSASAAQQ